MYGKYFASTFDGSMCGAGSVIFAIWGYVIANADKSGLLELNPKLISFKIGCQEQEAETAIGYLCQPDPRSRSDAEEGRRLSKEGQFLYRIVNHLQYQQIANDLDRKEYYRLKKRQSRSNGMSTKDIYTSTSISISKEKEGSGEKEPSAEERIYDLYPRRQGRTAALKAIGKVLKVEAYDKLVERVKAYKSATDRWPPTDRNFIPMPATWFNQGRYDDDPETWEPKQKSNGTRMRYQVENEIKAAESRLASIGNPTDDPIETARRRTLFDAESKHIARLRQEIECAP